MMTTASSHATDRFDGPEPGQFGKPTPVEIDSVSGGYPTESDNIKRNKDSAFIPPPFGSPHSNMLGTGELLTPWISGVPANPGGQIISGNNTYAPVGGPQASQGTDSGYSNNFTLPDGLFYADGSLGALSIPKLGMSAKVFEDESLETLDKGIGHFKFTSCWDGNVGFAAHNRGRADYFGQIHTLTDGDRIIYTTKLGTRTYEVYFVGQIHETDFSRLGRSDSNIVTLVTCVRDKPEMRWCVQAREIR
jgi:sortase A